MSCSCSFLISRSFCRRFWDGEVWRSKRSRARGYCICIHLNLTWKTWATWAANWPVGYAPEARFSSATQRYFLFRIQFDNFRNNFLSISNVLNPTKLICALIAWSEARGEKTKQFSGFLFTALASLDVSLTPRSDLSARTKSDHFKLKHEISKYTLLYCTTHNFRFKPKMCRQILYLEEYN